MSEGDRHSDKQELQSTVSDYPIVYPMQYQMKRSQLPEPDQSVKLKRSHLITYHF